MSNQVIDELRALLFGEEPYVRSRAPEPELVAELIPVLPKDLLSLLHSVSHFAVNETQLQSLFAALIKHLPGVENEGLRREILGSSLNRYPQLTNVVPDSLLDETLAVALTVPWIPSRIAALTLLAPRFPEPKQQEILRRAVTIVHEIDDIAERVRAMSKLASQLPESERNALAREALTLAQIIDSKKDKAETLAMVGLILGEPLKSEVVKQALVTASDIDYEDDRSHVLLQLAPYLPDHMLRNAFRVAEGLKDKNHKAMTIAALVSHMPQPLSKATLEKVLTSLQTIDWHEEQLKKITRIIARLPEPTKSAMLKEVLRAAETMPEGERRAQVLIELAPHLGSQGARAFFAAAAIEEKWWRARALSALYQYTPVPFHPEPRPIPDEVSAVSGTRIRQLLTQLPEQQRAILLEEAIDNFLDYYGGARKLAVEPLLLRAAPHERIINTGFSSKNKAERALDPAVPLALKQSYYFWFEVGPPAPGSIETKPSPLMIELLPSDARLKVVLFSFEDEIEITPTGDVGEIQIMPDGQVRVVKQVACPDNIPSGSDLLERRLFFPIRTPNKEGMFRLRCNIYYEQILVQSRLIKIRVARARLRSDTPALQSTLEYAMSKTLNPNYLVRMKPQKLSLMLNNNGDGTHCFRLIGAEDFKSDTCFHVRTLKNLIKHARGALRQASWGDEEPWSEMKHYQYEKRPDQGKLKDDLIRFAIWGYRFWARFTQKISGDRQVVEKLTNMMRKPSTLEFAIKDKSEASDYMFPASIIYDYPLDTNLDYEDYTLCPSFLKALSDEDSLEEARCFKGDCPSRGDLTVVCPSGFWGFRHSIGIPLGSAFETNHEMLYRHTPELTVAVFPSFERWSSHQRALKSFMPEMVWNLAESRSDTFEKLRSTNPHLVYFYCHGGIKKDTPFIKVGAEDEKGITPDNLLPHGIWWESPQPLIFINGCHTTALEPKSVLDFVTGFVVSHHAAGVIGTEIAIFESLACAFAEECLRRFLVEGEAIGDAVRGTRLKLLEQGNPLGLVYIIYANASLRLKKAN